MIEVKELTKKYGSRTAVDRLSFHIEKGVIYGFLGPNGAGKSTTMNILTGCLGATSGEVKIDGHDIMEEPMAAKKLIGYLPEQPPLYQDMTPEEYLRFVARAKGIRGSEIDRQVRQVSEKTGIQDIGRRLIRNLSKGYRQRVGIAQALLGDPGIIILDEPTVGLDPAQIIEIRDLIKDLGREHTVILSSHILSEVQAVCDSIMFIRKGRLIACDTAEKLTEMFAGKTRIRIEALCDEDTARDIMKDIAEIEEIDGVDEKNGVTRLDVTPRDGEDIREKLFRAFAGRDTALTEMRTERAGLEEIFLELTGEDAETPTATLEAAEKGTAEEQSGEEEETEQ